MNKQNSASRPELQNIVATKVESASDAPIVYSISNEKVAFNNLIENGKTRRKQSERREESSPIGSYLRKRKWEMNRNSGTALFQIQLLPCNS